MTAGLNEEAVTDWLADRVEHVSPPLRFTRITGGHSNLTYLVDDVETRRWVLRRPPLGELPSRAHDMAREHRIIEALEPSGVPVPRTVGHCADHSVIGAEFYVMEHVEGQVVCDLHVASTFPERVRSQIGLAVADTLATIHAVEPTQVGLEDLGRATGYVERQLNRWQAQLDYSKTRDLPVLDRVQEALARHAPTDPPARIVHGDYRLDNCLVSGGGKLVSVLDWELCTLGDPLADLGLLLAYWAEPGDRVKPPGGAPTACPGFPSRQQLLQRYQERSGRDCTSIEYYVALGYWKLACITEGVYRRYVDGRMAYQSDEWHGLPQSVDEMAAAADGITREWS